MVTRDDLLSVCHALTQSSLSFPFLSQTLKVFGGDYIEKLEEYRSANHLILPRESNHAPSSVKALITYSGNPKVADQDCISASAEQNTFLQTRAFSCKHLCFKDGFSLVKTLQNAAKAAEKGGCLSGI